MQRSLDQLNIAEKLLNEIKGGIQRASSVQLPHHDSEQTLRRVSAALPANGEAPSPDYPPTRAHKSKDSCMMALDAGNVSGKQTRSATGKADIVQVQEFTRGLQEDLLGSLVDGLVQCLGLKGPNDPSDVAVFLCKFDDDGEELINQYCVPLMIKTITKGIARLKFNSIETVAMANSRYASDPTTINALVGNIEHFEMGLDRYNGSPDGDNVELQMQMEFRDNTFFKTANYGGVETTLAAEWEYVVNPRPDKIYPGEQGLPKGDGTFYPGRNRKNIEILMKLSRSLDAKLTREEVIALRLYTGPSYMGLNKGLRMGGRKAKTKGTSNFAVTCAVLNSAIKKLRLVTLLPENRLLYRGLTGMSLPDDVLAMGSFVEFAFSSATPDPYAAKSYAGSDRASIFEIRVGKIDCGADIEEYSQYETEKEHVLPPLSHFEIVGRRREFGTNVYILDLNINLRARTLEELHESRRATALEIANKLDLECQHLTGHESVKIDKLVKHDIDPVGCDFFNKGRNFTNTLSKLESAFVAELEAEADSLLGGADKLPEEETYTRVEKLRARVKILNRCCDNNAEGKKKVLSAQELLVASVTRPGPFSMASTAAAAEDLVVLADYLIANTEFDRAMKMLQRAMEVSAALEPAATAQVALIFHQQGRVLLIMGKFLEAMQCMQQALDLRIQLSGHEHLDVAKTQGKMAKVFYKQGKYDEALEGYKTALETQIKVGGNEHCDVAQTQGKMAKVFYKQGQYDKALEGYKAALETHIKFGGQEHWNVALTQGKMAKVWYKQCLYDEALEAYQKALQIQIKFGGHQHSDVAQTHAKMAKIYRKQFLYDQAIQAYEAALETHINLYGHQYSDAAKNQANLATVYQMSQKHEKVHKLEIKIKLSPDFPSIDQTPENSPASWTKERKSKLSKEHICKWTAE